jgi:hypothetical protein
LLTFQTPSYNYPLLTDLKGEDGNERVKMLSSHTPHTQNL